MKIGLDLDGVLYPFHTAYKRWLVHHVARFPADCPEPTRWEFYEDWGLTTEEFLVEFENGVNSGWIFGHGNPFPGAVEQVQRLIDAGHSIHIITDRFIGDPGVAAGSTSEWLSEYKVPYDTLTFSRDKTVIPTSYMIDDKPANIAALAQTACIAYLLDQSWNQEADLPRVKSVEDFVDIVLLGEQE